jgi:hypothetical protein
MDVNVANKKWPRLRRNVVRCPSVAESDIALKLMEFVAEKSNDGLS